MKLLRSLAGKSSLLLLCALLCAPFPAICIVAGAPGTVSTVAGFGIMDRAGVDINLVTPGLMTSDSLGYVYFSDTANNVAYSRDPWNILDILAGDGIPGDSGDGGPASQSRLNAPTGIASVGGGFTVAPGSVLYIADTGNHRVRKLTKDNEGDAFINAFAGDGTASYKGDGGPAIQGGFVSPESLAVDAKGNLYVADRLDHRIRRIDAKGMLSTFAGNGVPGFSGDGGPATSAQLDQPTALLFDSQGNLLVSDQLNDRIRKITPKGVISTFVGGGKKTGEGVSPTDAAISRPSGMAFDLNGNFFITDGLKVRMLSGGKLVTVAGNGLSGWTGENGPPIDASFRHPFGLAVPLVESLLISDDAERRIRRLYGLDASGTIQTSLGDNLWDDTLATHAKLTLPAAVAPARDGTMLIADYGNRRIRSVESPHDPSTPRTPYYLYTRAGNGAKPPADGVYAFDADLSPPTGIAAGADGAYYFSEGEKGRVWEVDGTGALHQIAIPGLSYPAGIALGSDSSLFVADRDAGRVWKVASDGKASAIAGTTPGDGGDGGPAIQASLNAPSGVAVGTDGSVYVADAGNNEIKRITPDGILHVIAGDGARGYSESGPAASSMLSAPEGVAVDADGTVYAADTGNHRIVRIAGGTIQSIAGGPDPGKPNSDPITGDDLVSTAADAKFYEPADIAFDGQGNLYVADRRNHRIRVLWSVASVKASGGAFKPGDVNEDGLVNVLDVIMTLRIAIHSVSPADEQIALADVSPSPGLDGRAYGDGRVDTTDALRILRYSLGFIKSAQWP